MIEIKHEPSVLKIYKPTPDDIRVIEETFSKAKFKFSVNKSDSDCLIITEDSEEGYLAGLFGILDLSTEGLMTFGPSETEKLSIILSIFIHFG